MLAVKKQSIGSHANFVKKSSLEEITLEKDGLDSGKERVVVMEMTRTMTIVYTLASMERTFIPVSER